MKKSTLYILWAVAYGVCLTVGFLPNLTGFWQFISVLLGVLFFIPPFILLARARKENSRKTLLALRLICLISLILSLVLLVLNFLSVYFSETAGLWLYVLLGMVSCPMYCVKYWFLSLFLWACLLFATIPAPRPSQK